jgi:hypothetical protein
MIITHNTKCCKFGDVQSIIDYVDGVFLPNTLHSSSPMQQLLQASADVICWHNDIYSFHKVFWNSCWL